LAASIAHTSSSSRVFPLHTLEQEQEKMSFSPADGEYSGTKISTTVMDTTHFDGIVMVVI